MMDQKLGNPPSKVTLVYQRVNESHLFFADELPGLCISSPSLHDAYELAKEGVAEHIRMRWGKNVICRPEMSQEDLSVVVTSLAKLDASPVMKQGQVRFGISGSLTENVKAL